MAQDGSPGIYEEHLLDPARLRCGRAPAGGFVLDVDGKEYADLKIRLAFPLEAEAEFVGFQLPDGTELGMLERMDDLDAASRAVLQSELDKIYFRPRVVRMGRIVEEQGVLRGEIETTSGPRRLEIRGWRENVRLLGSHRAIIEDVDGNRYLVEDWRQLPKVTREILGL